MPTRTIKRTKFKLSPEQLLDMFYWLKLSRAFDERLSVLVRQGQVRSGVYTGIGQEAIIVGTCFGLRNEDYICPLHRDLGSFLMKGVDPRTMMSQMFAKCPRGAIPRCTAASTSSESSATRACSARISRSRAAWR
jgi:TPP-dependent pyruvate/acetoin dehydrogenase alpha subunit